MFVINHLPSTSGKVYKLRILQYPSNQIIQWNNKQNVVPLKEMQARVPGVLEGETTKAFL